MFIGEPSEDSLSNLWWYRETKRQREARPDYWSDATMSDAAKFGLDSRGQGFRYSE
jgi:hypothetical protein